MMKTFKQFFVLAGILLGTLAVAGHALAQEAPDVLVKRITMEVMETARTDKDIKAGNRKRIEDLVNTKILPHIDFERTTALAVGRYWRQATSRQRQQLIEEFRSLLMRTYAGALAQIGDQKLDFKPLRAGADDTEVEVRFEVLQARRSEPIRVGYRVYKTPDGWKVYDVNVFGIWMIETYRASFYSEIDRGGIDGLIAALKNKNTRPSEQMGPPANVS